jgi:hypothetical protein
LLGLANSSYVFQYTNSQKVLSYPITYNTSFTDDMAGSYTILTFTNNRTGTATFLADGYGTLIMPTGTINNVLRIKYTQSFFDVIDYGTGPITSTSETTTYNWIVEGNKNVLVSISYITTSVLGLTFNTKSVSYYPGFVSTEDLLSSNSKIQLFPNPTVNNALINVNLEESGFVNLALYSTSGQQVKVIDCANVPAGMYSRQVNLEDVPDGVYFIKMKMDNRDLFTRKIVKQ